MNVLQRFPLIGAALLAAIVVIILTGRGVSTTDAAPQDIVRFDRPDQHARTTLLQTGAEHYAIRAIREFATLDRFVFEP